MQETKRQSFIKEIVLLVEEDFTKTVADTIPYQDFVAPIGDLGEKDLPQVPLRRSPRGTSQLLLTTSFRSSGIL